MKEVYNPLWFPEDNTDWDGYDSSNVADILDASLASLRLILLARMHMWEELL